MTKAPSGTLAGLRVVVTRRRAQSAQAARALTAQGAEVVLLPALQIEPISPNPSVLAQCTAVKAAIAVSVNAVQCGLPWLYEHASNRLDWRWFAVGPTTAAELKNFDIDAIVPQRHDANGLLALPELRALGAADCALLLRGEGGRKVVAQTLREQGVALCELPVYRRTLPHVEPSQIEAIVDASQPTVVLVTSAETFDNLCLLFGERLAWLFKNTWLAVVSDRVGEHVHAVAARYGYDEAMSTRLWRLSGATTEATVAGLEHNWNHRRSQCAAQ